MRAELTADALTISAETDGDRDRLSEVRNHMNCHYDPELALRLGGIVDVMVRDLWKYEEATTDD